VTNDKDLLDLSKSIQKTLPFAIVTPPVLLAKLEKSR
jgi:hypothetical protein